MQKLFRVSTGLKFLFVLFTISLITSQLHAQNSLMAPVKKDGRWGYINDSGKIIIPAMFNAAANFKYGVAPVQIGPYWGYASPEGKWVLKPVFNLARSFNNRRAQISIMEVQDSSMITGFITPAGEFIYEIEPFEVAWDYHDNLVRVRSVNESGPAFGFRDTMGKWKIQPRFDACTDFSEGLAAVMISNKWSFIDETGHMILPIVYDEAFVFNEGYAYVKHGDKTGYINKKGKWLFTVKYDEVGTIMRNGMVAIREKGKVGFVNSKGKLVIKPQYDNIILPYFSEDKALVAVKADDGTYKWGFIDKKGKTIAEPRFEAAEPFNQGYAPVKINGKWGYINTSGKIVIEPQFEEAYDFSPTYR